MAKKTPPLLPPLLPLGALAAGFGLAGAAVAQQAAPTAPAAASAPAAAASAPAASQPVADAPAGEAVMPTVRARAAGERSGKQSLQATTSSIGKGQQALRDIPQSVTVVTERLIDDRNIETLKEALRNTAGITFQAAEGGEEDIRLRGFSLQSTGDIFVDGVRDPAFYERDSFNWDRLELLRGSASMLFGRGSTGGAANQVSKLPRLLDDNEVAVTLSSFGTVRGTADLNWVVGENAALRVNAMTEVGGAGGQKQDKLGFAPSLRWGIGTQDEFLLSAYYLGNKNGVNYGLPYLSGGLLPVDASNYYGLASDYSASTVGLGTFSHTHRFSPTSELKTTLRLGNYDRDLRASAIRFAAAALQPDGQAVTSSTFSAGSVLTRGANNLKIQGMRTAYLQSDYSSRLQGLGLQHELLAGVDAAHEKFRNHGFNSIAKPTTTIGTPDDGASIDESARVLAENRNFVAKGLGVYAQDMVKLAPQWKLLGGLRFDRFEGTYNNLGVVPAATNVCGLPVSAQVTRSDSLWSHRLGLLFQPTERQSYHLSYGTSFNTAGDAYQYDAGNADVDPEKSRNIELGAKLDSEDGRFSTRVALFHSTKYNERNRDSESVNACNYVLSGQRHAQGFELDFAGRLSSAWEFFASYAYIPKAVVDQSSGATGTEAVGSRPGLTPKHSGSLWTTYKLGPRWRVGGGLLASSSVQAVAGTAVVPRWVTADLMAEYTLADLSFKLNLSNITNKHYADLVYRGHYVPGKPRQAALTVAYKF
jgi:catecholate siderophore receptor